MKTKYIFFILFALIMVASTGFKMATHVKPESKHGDSFDLHKFRGKIVVLNFWASWSKVSRSENKNLLRTFQVYRLNPKVVFASISLDTEESAWKTAIQEDGLSWKDQFCDFKKYESPMAIKYGVNTLPKFFIFDTGGKQVSSASNSHDLETLISGLLK